MNDLKEPGTAFAERLRDAVDGGARSGNRRLSRRAARPGVSILKPVANPRRTRASDELFVDRIRRALD
jgi:hypothetical protein